MRRVIQGKPGLGVPGVYAGNLPPLRLCLSKGCVVTVCSYLMDQSDFPDEGPRPPINPKGTLRWYWERQQRQREWERRRRAWWEECRAEEEAERQHRRLLAVRARALRWVPPPAGS